MRARRLAAFAFALGLAATLPSAAHAAPPSAGSAAEPSPDLRAVLRPAAVLDPGAFTHRITLSVRASPEGVSRLRLTPEVLALARADLGDLRVIDGESRQWPYIIKPGAVQQLVDVTFAPPVIERGTSRYTVQLSAWPAQIDEPSSASIASSSIAPTASSRPRPAKEASSAPSPTAASSAAWARPRRRRSPSRRCA